MEAHKGQLRQRLVPDTELAAPQLLEDGGYGELLWSGEGNAWRQVPAIDARLFSGRPASLTRARPFRPRK